MRFALQDKESVIKRLEFKLDREKEDRGLINAGNFEDTINRSRIKGKTPQKSSQGGG